MFNFAYNIQNREETNTMRKEWEGFVPGSWVDNIDVGEVV